jgi:hypothetical protein
MAFGECMLMQEQEQKIVLCDVTTLEPDTIIRGHMSWQ